MPKLIAKSDPGELPRLTSSKGSSLTRNASWNFLSQIAGSGISLLVSLVSVPLLLRWLGSERFGATKVISDWFGYLSLLEMGLGASLLALLARAIGKEDFASARLLITAGWKIYLKIALAVFVVGLALTIILPALIKRHSVGAGEIWLAGLLSLLGAVLIPFNLGRYFLSVRQRDYATNLLLVLQSLLSVGFMLLFARLGWGIPGQMLGLLLGQGPMALFFGWALLREFPGFWREPATPQARDALWALNRPSFVSSVAGRIGFLSDNIIIATIDGSLAVTPFFLTQRLITIVQAQLQGLANASWAGLIQLHTKGEAAVFAARALELTGMVSGLGFAALAPLGAYNRHFILRWLGGAAYGGDAVTVLACVNAWLFSIFTLWGWIIDGGGEMKRWMPYAMAFAGINLAASLAGTWFFGLPGPLLGTLVSFLAVNSWGMPRLLETAFGLPGWKLWQAALRPALWGLPFTCLCVWFARHQAETLNWGALILQMGLSGLLGMTLWWCLSLGTGERRQWIGRATRLLGVSPPAGE